MGTFSNNGLVYDAGGVLKLKPAADTGWFEQGLDIGGQPSLARSEFGEWFAIYDSERGTIAGIALMFAPDGPVMTWVLSVPNAERSDNILRIVFSPAGLLEVACGPLLPVVALQRSQTGWNLLIPHYFDFQDRGSDRCTLV